jgi:putative nucleotidyltransferase with HDIG domain
MSTTQNAKTRSERAANLQVDRYPWRRVLNRVTSLDALARFGIAVAAALVITFFVRGWEPPFAYRKGYIPQRSILARVPFKVNDDAKTNALRYQAAREVLCIYENNREPLVQLRGAVKDALFAIREASDPTTLTKKQTQSLDLFGATVLNPDEKPMSYEQALAAIHASLGTDADISKFDSAMREVMDPLEEFGLIRSLQHDIEQGNQRYIRVFKVGDETKKIEAEVQRIRIAEVAVTLRGALEREFRNQFGTEESRILARMVHSYLASQLPETLSIREDLSNKARQEAVANVKTATVSYEPKFGALVPIGRMLDQPELALLRAEHLAYTQQLSLRERIQRLCAFLGLIAALYLLCGFFIYQSLDRTLLSNTWQLFRLLALCCVCIVLAVLASNDPFRAEVIPVTITSIVATIAFGRPTALMLMAALALVIAFSTRVDLSEFIVLTSAAAGSILLCGRIRTRTRLMYVGAGVAAVVFMTVMGLGVMTGQTGGSIVDGPGVGGYNAASASLFPVQLAKEALWQAVCILLCGPFMTGLLPVAEKLFDVQTDLSLLDLCDMNHVLLRQLAQRAPGTYNHSISVAALAESAADSIGAHGLLVRVGACFHDIGKMFKPNYFAENQSPGTNRHDTLQPAMSTLVIIAHVKDGADLARRHGLPKPVIDFIEQHHGTTLVEYFFRLAAKKSEQDPHGEEILESTFRYPGPKPQTREAAVLMLADAVESASRALVEPTASRLQNLVDQIAMKKLMDGQFDECGLTLQELDTVKRSLIKSLTAIYHGRVKYPDQQSAG